MCQCPVCYELFSGESTFALHRIEGMRVTGYPGEYWLTECRDPASKGMTLNPHGVWTLPLQTPWKPVPRGLGDDKRVSPRHCLELAA